MRNYRTEVHPLTADDLQTTIELGMSVFFNLDQFFPARDCLTSRCGVLR